MVISIIMVIVGVVVDGAAADRPVPRTSRRRRSSCTATYVGADALTVEQSVATPIEQQMSGVDNMIYMYSINASNGQMTLQRRLRRHHRCRTSTRSWRRCATRRPQSQLPLGRAQLRRHHQEVDHQPAGAVLALLAERHLRRALPDQLRLHQHQRSDDARARRRPGDDLRRRPVRHALLGATRHARQARHHGHRDPRRAASSRTR